MGTSQAVGPGFTDNSQRLSVLLTRACCGMAIVGDVKSCDGTGKHSSGAPTVKNPGTGEFTKLKVGVLKGIYDRMKAAGRVATIRVNEA